MKLTFYGGAKIVTGCNYLLEANGLKILVDCGLFQGPAKWEEYNRKSWPYDPGEIDYLLVTHSHIDHIGRIPKLWKDGFKGKIFCTKPVVDFAKIFLTDAAKVMSYEAPGAEGLYTQKEVDGCGPLFNGVDYHEKVRLTDDIEIEFFDAGHILGSSFIKLKIKNKKSKPQIKNQKLSDANTTTIVFSGDLGNYPVPILRDTEALDEADYILIDSVYGNKVHEPPAERKNILEDVIEDVYDKSGTLMIPSFSMERTQEILYEMNDLFEHYKVPQMPVYMDSPLAIRATKIYEEYENLFDKEARGLIKSGDDLFKFPGLQFTMFAGDSKKINSVKPPKIVIAGSGMSTGGRILFHEQRYLPDPNSYILFIGYQVEGTLGRRILDGAERVRIMGRDIDVKCGRIAVGGYSAHADQPRLLKWVYPVHNQVKKVFVVQGEEEQANGLKYMLMDEMGIDAVVPSYGDSFEL